MAKTKAEVQHNEEQPRDYFAEMIGEMIASGELDLDGSFENQWDKILLKMVDQEYNLFDSSLMGGGLMEPFFKAQAKRIFLANQVGRESAENKAG